VCGQLQWHDVQRRRLFSDASADGSGIGAYEGTNTVAITTTKNNDIVLVFIGFGDGSVPTAGGLSFSRRSGAPFASNQIDYYWAVVSTAGTYTINTIKLGTRPSMRLESRGRTLVHLSIQTLPRALDRIRKHTIGNSDGRSC
jgi:hypothetical protein